jgi:rare lipoprotein A
MPRLARLAGVALLVLAPAVAQGQAAQEEPPAPPVPGTDGVPVVHADTGEATYYHDALHNRRTASGERMDQQAYVAAHRRYPFGTWLRVTNLRNGRSVLVRVIDRGPFGSLRNQQRTIVDLSRRAASELGFIRQGRVKVKVERLAHAPEAVEAR